MKLIIKVGIKVNKENDESHFTIHAIVAKDGTRLVELTGPGITTRLDGDGSEKHLGRDDAAECSDLKTPDKHSMFICLKAITLTIRRRETMTPRDAPPKKNNSALLGTQSQSGISSCSRLGKVIQVPSL